MYRIIRVLNPRLMVGALALFAAGSLSASTLCTSVGATLNDFIGESCSIGNLLFTFPTSGSYADTNNLVPASSVDVTIVGDGTPGVQTGFIFTGDWANSAGSSQDVHFSFSAAVSAPLLYINSATMGLDVEITPGEGYVGGGETLAGTGGGTINLVEFSTSDNSGTASLDGTSFTATKDLAVQSFGSGTTELSSITETFTYGDAPEPGPFVLTAGGIALVFLLRRREQLLHLLGLAALVLVISSGSAHGSQLCTDVGSTLDTFLSAGSCTIGDVLFTFTAGTPTSGSWQYSGNASTVYSTNETYVGIDNSNGVIGFDINPTFTEFGPGQSETLAFSITAQALSNQILGASGYDTTFTYGAGQFTTASLDVETGGSDIPTTPAGNDPMNLLTIGSASATFATPIASGTTLTLTENFVFSTGSGTTDIAHISDVDIDVIEANAVPEPLTMVLTGSSLLGFAFYLRRKRRRI